MTGRTGRHRPNSTKQDEPPFLAELGGSFDAADFVDANQRERTARSKLMDMGDIRDETGSEGQRD